MIDMSPCLLCGQPKNRYYNKVTKYCYPCMMIKNQETQVAARLRRKHNLLERQ